MVLKREEAKQRLQDHSQNRKLSFDGLYQYLLWLTQSDLDIFAHLSEKEQQELKRQWPASWFNNDSNNINPKACCWQKGWASCSLRAFYLPAR